MVSQKKIFNISEGLPRIVPRTGVYQRAAWPEWRNQGGEVLEDMDQVFVELVKAD